MFAASQHMPIVRSLRELAAACSEMMLRLETAIAVLSNEFQVDEKLSPRAVIASPPGPVPDKLPPLIDCGLMSINWRGHSCFLGNTLPFKLFERLARRPNHYVHCDQLLVDVWRGRRSIGAVRSVIKVLRQKLCAAGMSDLAQAIDGSVAGHYALKLPNME